MELNRAASSRGRVDPEERAGKALRQLRLAQGWSQEEVAVRMTAYGHDFHQTSIAKVESAQRPLRVRELADFAALYGVAVQDLLYGPTRSIAEVDREIAEVEERLEQARAVAGVATADLDAARNKVYAAEASYRTAAAGVATLEGRLSALRADRPKLPQSDPVPESSNTGASDDGRRHGPASGNTSSAARIALGAHLRRLREASGIRPEDAALKIRASDAKLSRLESGRMEIRAREVAGLLTLYGVADKVERRQIFELVRASSSPDTREAYSDVFPSWFNTYIGLEMGAAEVQVYEAQYIPDLLQTEDYAHAITAGGNKRPSAPPDVDRRMIDLRTGRKRIFFQEENPPRLRVVLDEAALCRQVGGPEVMRGQLTHVISMAKLPNVTIQVTLLANGNHYAGRSFRILHFNHNDMPDTVYIEQLTSALYLDSASQVVPYQRVMRQLRSQALTPGETTSFVQRLLAA